MNEFEKYRIENAIFVLKTYEDALRNKENYINRDDCEMDVFFDILDDIEKYIKE